MNVERNETKSKGILIVINSYRLSFPLGISNEYKNPEASESICFFFFLEA